jgi:hypothetical protein
MYTKCHFRGNETRLLTYTLKSEKQIFELKLRVVFLKFKFARNGYNKGEINRLTSWLNLNYLQSPFEDVDMSYPSRATEFTPDF